MNIIINKYIDSIQNATSMTNLEMKLKPILMRNFRYNFYGIYGNVAGRKTSFYRNIYPRMKLYQDEHPKITEKDKEKEKQNGRIARACNAIRYPLLLEQREKKQGLAKHRHRIHSPSHSHFHSFFFGCMRMLLFA